jgi:hypothetical protein
MTFSICDCRFAIGTVLLALATGLPAAEPRGFLFLKTGERFATQEVAGPTVKGLTDYLAGQLGVADGFVPQVMNQPVKAAEFCAARKPALGIVTAGFFLAYEKALGMEPLLEVHREKVAAERQVLVTRQDGPADLTALQGKPLATGLAAEQVYVLNVVLQGKLGQECRLVAVTDPEGAVFDLADGAAKAPASVLLEEHAWKLFAADTELAAKLKVIFASDELPRDLVVLFRPNAAGLEDAAVQKALQTMTESAAGKTVLSSVLVTKFAPVDQERLANARKLYHGP